MNRLKAYLFNNFEQIIVFAILISILFIHYFVLQKMAFLNFYYLPVLFSGYFLGRRVAVLSSFFCVLLVVVFFITTPQFFIKIEGNLEIIVSLMLWGSFLMLTSYVTGTLFEHKGRSIQDLRNAYLGVLEILPNIWKPLTIIPKDTPLELLISLPRLLLRWDFPRRKLKILRLLPSCMT